MKILYNMYLTKDEVITPYSRPNGMKCMVYCLKEDESIIECFKDKIMLLIRHSILDYNYSGNTDVNSIVDFIEDRLTHKKEAK